MLVGVSDNDKCVSDTMVYVSVRVSQKTQKWQSQPGSAGVCSPRVQKKVFFQVSFIFCIFPPSFLAHGDPRSVDLLLCGSGKGGE